jgi:velvet factor protein
VDEPFLLLSCALLDESGATQLDLVLQKKTNKRFEALVGEKTIHPRLMADEDGVNRMLFIFTDLSVRVPGTFRLRFDLIDLHAG